VELLLHAYYRLSGNDIPFLSHRTLAAYICTRPLEPGALELTVTVIFSPWLEKFKGYIDLFVATVSLSVKSNLNFSKRQAVKQGFSVKCTRKNGWKRKNGCTVRFGVA
jgi:hypothetical protein